MSRATALGLLVALAGPDAVILLSRFAGENPSIVVQLVLQAIFCGLAVAILLIVRYGERLPMDSIGLRMPTRATLSTAALLFVVGFFLLPFVTDPLVRAFGLDGAQAGIAELAKLPGWFRVVLGATGGVVEETLYRGYLIERLAALTGRRWLGASLATVAFALAHVPTWGVGFALAADLPAGIVLTVFYLWRRDLIANMLAHSTSIVIAMFTIVPAAG